MTDGVGQGRDIREVATLALATLANLAGRRQRSLRHRGRRLDDLQITIAGVRFDRVRYDAEADVLYLHVGNPSTATDFEECQEGHHLCFDGRRVTVTLPEPVEVAEVELRRVIQAA